VRPPPVVFGDRHGASIAPHLLQAAIAAARSQGFEAGCNSPYAGGYVVTRHGAPAQNVHALQIEIDRSFYLDRTLREPGPGFDRAAAMIAAVAAALADEALGPASLAAE
jgi:N-formylglutamate amidohydrolase